MKKLWKMAAIGAALVLSLGLVAGCGSDQPAQKSDAPKVAVLDKSKSNLALARRSLVDVEREMYR